MSDSVPTYGPSTHLDHIDDRTKLIINGYVREAQQSIFTLDIALLLLAFIDDHFMMHRGSYQWKISDPQLIHNILHSQRNQCFTSDVLEISKLNWVMKLHPNGSSHTRLDQFNVYVELLSMPPSWSHVVINQTIICHETNTKFICIGTYKAYQTWGWPPDTLLLSQVSTLNPKQLTFTVKHKILRIVTTNALEFPNCLKFQSKVENYRRNYHFFWKIPQKSVSRRVCSDVMGDMFCAFYDVVDNLVVLQLCGLPNAQQLGVNVGAVQVKWTLTVTEAGLSFTTVALMGYDTCRLLSKCLITGFVRENYSEFEEFTFRVQVEILCEYDLDGNIIGGNVEDEWDRFIETEAKAKDKAKDKDEEDRANGSGDAGTGTGGGDGDSAMRNGGLNETYEDLRIEIDQREKFRRWLSETVKLPQYYSVLVVHGFDNMDAIGAVNDSVLQQIGIEKIGHRTQIMKHVQRLTFYVKVEVGRQMLGLIIVSLLVLLLVGYALGVMSCKV